MTAGVEGLPTDARDRLAAVALAHMRTATSGCHCGDVQLGESYTEHLAGVLLPVVAELCDEARADELRAAAAALHVQRFNADEEPDNRWPPGVRREVPSFYRGVVMAEHHLRNRAKALTAPQPAEAPR